MGHKLKDIHSLLIQSQSFKFQQHQLINYYFFYKQKPSALSGGFFDWLKSLKIKNNKESRFKAQDTTG
jgi:hypothetical protein